MTYKWLLLSFNGRIGRQTYWLTTLGFLVAFTLSGMLVDFLGEETGSIVVFLIFLLICYMSLAVAAKRWHDRDKSGWWSLISLTGIGAIWMLIENGFLRGTQGPNRFGPDPIRAPAPVPVVHEGKTYYRQPNGSFMDALGNPVTSVALVAALGATYLAMRAAAPDSYTDHSWNDNSSSSSSASDDSSGGSWWSSGSGDSSSDSGWSSADSGGGGSD